MARPRLEVADILRVHGTDYVARLGERMTAAMKRVMRVLALCRTLALGGHVRQCDACGHQEVSYNSCRDRHCPKCGSLATTRWLEARRRELLPVTYFHVVFTIPEQLNALALANKKVVYGILFDAAAKTLLLIAADPKHLGAHLGFFGVLHTWGQTLLHHPHVHFVVPGGGLSPDRRRFVHCRPLKSGKPFFLPVRVLSHLFRGLFLHALDAASRAGKLQFSGGAEALADPRVFAALLRTCRRLPWVVYAKPPFGGPEQVLRYLSRYTHRIAISNDRLLSLEDGQVTFAYKDYRQGSAARTMTLSADEFIRRFLLHVLPDRFVRIRNFGFLANRCRAEQLALCRKLLGVAPPPPPPRERPPWNEVLEQLTGKDPLECPQCHQGRLVLLLPLVIGDHPRPPPPP